MVIKKSTKLNRVQDLIDLISNNKKVHNIVQVIHIYDIFLFTYNVYKEVGVDGNYPNPGYNVDNFKAIIKVVVEFQINSRNFKASKKIDVVKAYLFRLVEIYLVNNLSNKIISTSKKRCPKDNE